MNASFFALFCLCIEEHDWLAVSSISKWYYIVKWGKMRLQVLLSVCLFTSQKCTFIPKIVRNCPLFFRIILLFSRSVLLFPGIALLFSRNALLFYRSVFLYLKNVDYSSELPFSFSRSVYFLFTVSIFFQEYPFSSRFYLPNDCTWFSFSCSELLRGIISALRLESTSEMFLQTGKFLTSHKCTY